MELLSLNEIRIKLGKIYEKEVINNPNVFNIFIPKLASDLLQRKAVVHQVQQVFGIFKLHNTFIEVLELWDLGELWIGGFEFCRTGDYAEELISMNSDELAPGWWEVVNIDIRPTKLLMIAQSDPYVAILNTVTGEVMTYVDVDGFSSSKMSAKNLLLFLRGLGTIEINIKNQPSSGVDKWVECISEKVGGNNYAFWKDVAELARDR